MRVSVSPNAGENKISGTRENASGSLQLAVRVTAAPDKGKANAAVIKLLSKVLGQPKSAFTIVSGETARQKTIEIAAQPDDIDARLDEIMDRQ